MSNIVLLTYSHKHGTDTIPCATREIAHNQALLIVSEWRSSFVDEDTRTNEELLDDWLEYSGGSESFTFNSVELVTSLVDIPEIDRSEPGEDLLVHDLKADYQARYNDLKRS